MQVFYTPRYYADIGDGHVFPIRKFEFVRDRLLTEGTLQPEELVEPSPAALAHHLPAVFAHNPEIIFYLAGADPYAGDKLGRLAVSGKDINDTIEIHCNTIRMVKKVFESRAANRRLA